MEINIYIQPERLVSKQKNKPLLQGKSAKVKQKKSDLYPIDTLNLMGYQQYPLQESDIDV